MSEAPIIEPLSLYDLLRRLPATADEPIDLFGEVMAYLCEMLENFRIETKLRSSTTVETSEDMQNFIIEVASEAATACLNEELLCSYEELMPIVLKTFSLPAGILEQPMEAPTQSDIEALKEQFSEIKTHHGKAAVIGRFLRECGVEAEELVVNGGVYDIDFTALPNQMFWCLARICKRYAPKVKLME